MLQIKIGEQKAINYSLKMKSTSLPVNLTSSKIIFQVKEDENQIDNFLIEKTIICTMFSTVPKPLQRYTNRNRVLFLFFSEREKALLLAVYRVLRQTEHRNAKIPPDTHRKARSFPLT